MAQYPPYTNPLEFLKTTIYSPDPVKDETQFMKMANDAQLLANNPDALQMAELFAINAAQRSQMANAAQTATATGVSLPGANILIALNEYISE